MKFKITVQKGKQFARTKDLFRWDENPRLVMREDFDRLKKILKKFGQFKPLLVTPEGEVIGGNSRLEALKEQGVVDVWVSVMEPKTKAEKIEIAIADNDMVGKYIEEDLASLLMETEGEIELKDYKIDMGKDINLSQVLESIGPSSNEDIFPDEVNEKHEKSKILNCPNCGHEIPRK